MYCFCNGQRGCGDLKIVYISNFSQVMSEGGIKSLFSPKFKKIKFPRDGVGGQEYYGQFLGFSPKEDLQYNQNYTSGN